MRSISFWLVVAFIAGAANFSGIIAILPDEQAVIDAIDNKIMEFTTFIQQLKDAGTLETLLEAFKVARIKPVLKNYVEVSSPLVTTRDEFQRLQDDLEELLQKLKTDYEYTVSKVQYFKLKDKLVDAIHWAKKNRHNFDHIDNKFKCKLKKMCFEDDFSDAQDQFVDLWSGVEKVKKNCKKFSKSCMKKFEKFKVKFETFNKDVIDKLNDDLRNICDMHCFNNERDRFIHQRALLTLDVSVKGTISAVQFAVKYALVREFESVGKSFHYQKERMNAAKLKLADAKTKDELADALADIKKVQEKAKIIISDFDDAQDYLKGLEGWLTKEDFDYCSKLAARFEYTLDGFKKQIEDCVTEAKKRHRLTNFEQEIQMKEEDFKALYKKLQAKVQRIKRGQVSLCAHIDSLLLDQFKELKPQFEECGDELENLLTTLTKDFKEIHDFDRLNQKLKKLIEHNETHEKLVNKYIYFLNIYHQLFCDHEFVVIEV